MAGPYSSGDCYIDTDNGTDAITGTQGRATGAGAWRTLKYAVTTGITTLTGDLIIHCVGTTADNVSGTTTFSGKSTASYKLTIQGDRWTNTSDATLNSSYYTIGSGIDNTLYNLSELNVEFNGVQFNWNHAGTPTDYMISLVAAAAVQTIVFKNCLFVQTNLTATGIAAIAGSLYAGSTLTIRNCVFKDFVSGAISLSAGTGAVENCTLKGNATGVSDAYCVVRNCVFDTNTADEGAQTWPVGCDYNSTTLAGPFSRDGGHCYYSCTDFNWAGAADLRPTATTGDPDVRNSGVTITGCSPDPLGTARPSETNYTRGAFEYKVTSVSNLTVRSID